MSNPLRGIILSIVDESGPHPQGWHPNFATLSQILNSAVKSFSIMIGDKAYREKSLLDLTCFGILPFQDMNAVGFIHFFGVNRIPNTNRSQRELPITLTLMFDEAYRDTLCQKSPQIHQFLENETKNLSSTVLNEQKNKALLENLYNKLIKFLE
ncbi:MAG TPA: hypothetical protein VMV49_12695 [Candidatus Deferrimicrobium sp.]|nr:hypothetical protein [Candidatus Deferrimicrobium sp.]